jgi:hypothetical protein
MKMVSSNSKCNRSKKKISYFRRFMEHKKPLTREQRYQIEALLHAQKSQKEIAGNRESSIGYQSGI